MYASRDVPLGMLVPAGAENGQAESQARQEQQRQLEQQQQQGRQGRQDQQLAEQQQQQQEGPSSEGDGSTPAERQQSAAAAAAVQVSATRVMHDMLESKLPKVRSVPCLAGNTCM